MKFRRLVPLSIPNAERRMPNIVHALDDIVQDDLSTRQEDGVITSFVSDETSGFRRFNYDGWFNNGFKLVDDKNEGSLAEVKSKNNQAELQFLVEEKIKIYGEIERSVQELGNRKGNPWPDPLLKKPATTGQNIHRGNCSNEVLLKNEGIQYLDAYRKAVKEVLQSRGNASDYVELFLQFSNEGFRIDMEVNEVSSFNRQVVNAFTDHTGLNVIYMGNFYVTNRQTPVLGKELTFANIDNKVKAYSDTVRAS